MDLCVAPFVLIAAFLLKVLRRAGVERFPISRRCLSAVGVFPIVDHYYEPLINFDLLIHPLEQARNLPGVDLNTRGSWSCCGSSATATNCRRLLFQNTMI
jgi:hypothetical protein